MRKALALLLALTLLALGAAPAAAAATFTFTGRVSRPDGSPAAGARVQLLRYGAGRVAATLTDDTGRYRLQAPAVAGYDYWLRAAAPGFALADSHWLEPLPHTVWDAALRAPGGSVRGAVRDAAGHPLPGAEVLLVHAGWGVLARATAADGGGFSFPAVPAGRYTVRATAAGYTGAESAPLTVRSGTEWADLALAPAAGRVSGYVVSNQDGRPVAGARAEVFRKGWGTVAVAGTDARGRFEFELPAVAAPEYQVRVWPEGLALAASAFFALSGGTGVDLKQLTTQAVHGDVSGTVTDVVGVPLEGIPVVLDLQGVGIIARTASARDGAYRFDGLVAGGPQYRVRALPDDQNRAAAASPWFQAGSGAETLQYLAVRPATSLRGGFAFAKVAGQVTDPAGRPVADALVELRRDGTGEVVFTATTGPDGRYAFEKVAPVAAGALGYRLEVSKADWVTTDQNQAADGAGVFRPAAARTVPADVTLHAGAGALGGRVLDPAGAPVAGAAVVLFEVGRGEVARVQTDAGGTYRFAGVPGGFGARYRLLAVAAGYLASDLAAGSDLPLEPVPAPRAAGGDAYDLKAVPAGAGLSGLVTGAAGHPLAGAAVVARDALGRTVTAVTGARGTFTLSGLAPGLRYDLTATLDGHYTAAARVDAPLPGATATLALRLVAATGAVRGTLVGPDGAPLPGRALRLAPEGGGAALTATTDAHGGFAFPAVPAGPGRRYVAEVDAGGTPLPVEQAGAGHPLAPLLVLPGGAVDMVLVVP